MNEPMETLARRLDRVERENRRLKRAGVVALAVIAAVVLMGQAMPKNVPKVVEAERFMVRDASGTVRAVLDESLWLFGKDRSSIIRLSMIPHFTTRRNYEMPLISPSSEDGRTEIKAGVDELPMSIEFTYGGGVSAIRAQMGAAASGSFLRFRDSAGKVIWSAP